MAKRTATRQPKTVSFQAPHALPESFVADGWEGDTSGLPGAILVGLTHATAWYRGNARHVIAAQDSGYGPALQDDGGPWHYIRTERVQ